MKAEELHDILKKLTVYVRKAKGKKEAMKFYIDYIQPIKEYFKELNNESHTKRF